MAAAGLVLLPGIDGTAQLFGRLEQQLAAAWPTRSLSYPTDVVLGYGELVERVLHAIGSDQVILLGESFSGPIAIEVAARRPRQIAGLVLAATFAISPVFPPLLRFAAGYDLRRIPRPIIHAFLLGRRRDHELAAKIDQLRRDLPRHVIAARLVEIANVDARPALTRAQCPILVLHGAGDRLIRPSKARRMLAANPSATLRLLPGPHTLLQSSPVAAAREILAFVHRCAVPPQAAS